MEGTGMTKSKHTNRRPTCPKSANLSASSPNWRVCEATSEKSPTDARRLGTSRPTAIFLVILSSLLSSSLASAQQDDASAHILLVVGAGGTPEYAEQFEKWADIWVDVAEKSSAIVTPIGRSERTETTDREQLEKAIKSLPSSDPAPVWVVLIGHGTYANNVAKFNMRGPDVSARQLAGWIEPLERTVVIVDCASASGPFVNRLSGKNRIIVTATKSGTEQNYARFGKYFAQAIGSPQSDLDHDDEISVHEAFIRASADVQRFYDSEARISTEHALIDDNGDGKGTPAKMFRGTRAVATARDGSNLDGKRASRITLSPTAGRLPFTSDELAQRDDIERQLDQLHLKKKELGDEKYSAQLESLLLQLARIYQRAEQRLEKKETPKKAE